MDEQSARSIYQQRIDSLTESLLPNGGGFLSAARLRHALDQVAQVAFSAGHDFAWSNLGRKAGSATSERKRKSSADNGRLGGRPKKKGNDAN